MSFERLIVAGAFRNKRRSGATISATALAAAGNATFSAAFPDSHVPLVALLGVIGIAAFSAWRGGVEREANDSSLYRLGFSREQIGTLWVLENALLGGLGALLGVVLSLALARFTGEQVLPASLSLSFVSALFASALGATIPAYLLARSELSRAPVDD